MEVRLDRGGVPCLVSDTAGLRDAAAGSEGSVAAAVDVIEKEGMRRAMYESAISYY